MTTQNDPIRPDAGAYPLQAILFPKAGIPSSLYITGLDIEGRDLSEGAPLKLAKGLSLSTGTFFNSFYRDYWRTYTDLAYMGVQIRFCGKIAVSIYGVETAGEISLLARQEIAAPASKPEVRTIWEKDWVPEAGFDVAPVRLSFEIEALTDCAVYDMGYVTDAAPLRTVSLSVGLCSFNREDDLCKTVAHLQRLKARLPDIRDVFVVNQGKEFTSPALLSLLAQPGFHHFKQGNLGGTGGFTRTMIEALSMPTPATYHLVMDDDIDLDARVIERGLNFLKYTRKEIAVGGQMLDLWRKNFLFEAGATLNKFWTVNSLGAGTDLADPAELQFFDTLPDLDYNAWWFCMIPTRVIQTLGFPPPIFIHVDDIEYGCRMKSAGVQTVSLPGVAVWHEPFTYKKNDWMPYYDLRNRLINSADHPEISEQPDALFVLGFIMNFVLIHRYRAAHLACRAIRDFLKGPTADIWLDSARAHEDLTSFLNEMDAPPLMSDISAADFREMPKMRLPGGTWAIVKRFVTTFVVLNLPARKGRKPFIVHGDAHPGGIGAAPYLHAANESVTEGRLYKPVRGRLWFGLIEALSVTLSYGFRRKSASRRWKAGLPQLEQRDAWVRMFKKSTLR